MKEKKLNNYEIENLKKWAKKFFDKSDLDYQTFDTEAHIDNKITYAENKTQLGIILKKLFKETLTNKEVKNQKEKEEYTIMQKYKEEEEKTENDFNKSLEILKENKESFIKHYEIPKEYIKSVARGFNKAFIFLGEAGIGKTYLTRQILMKEKVKFIENRGVNSPLALYQFLYENNEENLVLVFDDTTGIINNPNSFSVLLNVLWEGFAEWNTTSDKLKIPKKFRFKGKIIFISNKLTGENSEIIKSRCLLYELKLSNKDKIKMMYNIAKQKHEDLTKKERFEIVNFIKNNVNESTKNFDLRLQQKIENLYLYDKENWEKLSKPLFEKNDDMEFLMFCIKKSNTTTEAEKMFVTETGRSRRTFYNIKKEIGLYK